MISWGLTHNLAQQWNFLNSCLPELQQRNFKFNFSSLTLSYYDPKPEAHCHASIPRTAAASSASSTPSALAEAANRETNLPLSFSSRCERGFSRPFVCLLLLLLLHANTELSTSFASLLRGLWECCSEVALFSRCCYYSWKRNSNYLKFNGFFRNFQYFHHSNRKNIKEQTLLRFFRK